MNKTVLQEIEKQSEKVKSKLGKLRGSYRLLLVEAKSFHFAWMDSKERTYSFSQKVDLEEDFAFQKKLQKEEERKEGPFFDEEKRTNDNNGRGDKTVATNPQSLDLVLSFILPAGSYATMFMRELMLSNNLEKYA